jgi:hypothetical protein
MLQFVHFEATAKKIAALPIYQSVCKNIYLAATLLLKKNMFTLQMLPRFEQLTAKRVPLQRQQSEPSLVAGASSLLGQGLRKIFQSSADVVESVADLADSGPKVANYEALVGKMLVLQEQHGQLKQFLSGALDEGRHEEAVTLQRAIAEVQTEVEQLKRIMQKPGRSG